MESHRVVIQPILLTRAVRPGSRHSWGKNKMENRYAAVALLTDELTRSGSEKHRRMKTSTAGYMRCDYFIVTQCIIVHDVI